MTHLNASVFFAQGRHTEVKNFKKQKMTNPYSIYGLTHARSILAQGKHVCRRQAVNTNFAANTANTTATFVDTLVDTFLTHQMTHGFSRSSLAELSALTSCTGATKKNSLIRFVFLFHTHAHACLNRTGNVTHITSTAYSLNLDCLTVKTAVI